MPRIPSPSCWSFVVTLCDTTSSLCGIRQARLVAKHKHHIDECHNEIGSCTQTHRHHSKFKHLCDDDSETWNRNLHDLEMSIGWDIFQSDPTARFLCGVGIPHNKATYFNSTGICTTSPIGNNLSSLSKGSAIFGMPWDQQWHCKWL